MTYIIETTDGKVYMVIGTETTACITLLLFDQAEYEILLRKYA